MASRKKKVKKKYSAKTTKKRNTLVERLLKIIRTYERVMIVFNNAHTNEPNRRRLIKKDGSCKVNYTISQYNPITRTHTSSFASDEFSKCCFLDYKPKGRTLRDTVKKMVSHDRGSYKPAIIYYGRKFAKGMEFK